jgi:hypothetical protein
MPRSKALVLPAALILAAMPLACGGKSDPKPAASDTSVPLEGRSVSRPNQLAATWMAISDGPLAGVEFLKDGQAMLTRPGAGTTTVSYKVLDDGRVSLVTAHGATTNYKTTLSGDILELAPEQPGAATQRFSKVASGQTLAEAIAAHEAKIVAEMERRILGLRDTLLKGNAVITSAEGDDRWTMAMNFDDLDRSLNGSMVLDTPIAGRNDALNPIRVLAVRGDTGRADARSNRIRVVLNAGPASEPAGQQEVTGQIVLTIDGPIEKPTITGEATFPKLWPGPRPVTLSTDAKAFAAANEKLERQRAAIRAEIARMETFLAGRTVFVGQKSASQAGVEPVRLVVERNEQDTGYTAAVSLPNRDNQPAQAAIELVLGQAALFINTPWGEQWRLQTNNTPDTLDGLWRPNNRTDFISHGNLSLSAESRLSIAELAAERAAIEKFLTEKLRSPQRFVGFVERRFGQFNTVRWPVSVEVQAASDTAVTGSGWMIAHRDGVTLTGTRAGRSFSLQGNTPLPGSNDPRQTDAQLWTFELAAIDPAPTLVGDGTRNRHGSGRTVLTLATPEHTAALREQLVTALTSARYTARTADTSSVRDEQMFFVFDSVDAEAGKVSGRIIGDGNKWNNAGAPPALFDGDIVTDHGMPILRLTVRGAPDPARGGGKVYDPFTLELAAFELDGTLHLTGSTPPGTGNQDWLTLDPVPAEFDIPMDPMRETRLAALRLGAIAERITYVERKPGDVAIVLVEVTERDAKVGQIFFQNGRYHHGNSVAAAAIHAGLAAPGEVVALRQTFGEPFTGLIESVERNGVVSSRIGFRPDNKVPTFTLERVPLE